MKHTKVKMIGGKCIAAGLIERDDAAHSVNPYINVWYHNPDAEKDAIKLFNECDKSHEMFDILKNLPIHQLSITDTTKDRIEKLIKEIEE